ncbi:hypothetical protein JB92DRAFT_3098909 [Gautieria morchelliformis]|nr:hypothetical protein JB92DRAFT_3098909 [Gautieria morchelliformis]
MTRARGRKRGTGARRAWASPWEMAPPGECESAAEPRHSPRPWHPPRGADAAEHPRVADATEHKPERVRVPGKTRRRHQEPRRPGTGDSSQALLAAANLVGGVESGSRKGAKDKKAAGAGVGAKDKDKDKKAAGLSQVYMFYRHSLNSLTDIVDKDDKASLAELHHYLNRSESGSSSSSYSNDEDDDADNAPSTSPLARRRSLPARTSVSLLSLASTSPTSSTLSRDPDPALAPPSAFSSTFSFAPPHPDPIFTLSTSSLSPTRTGTPADPQRRKRAATLARFFGVDSNCRGLFRDVLASLRA